MIGRGMNLGGHSHGLNINQGKIREEPAGLTSSPFRSRVDMDPGAGGRLAGVVVAGVHEPSALF